MSKEAQEEAMEGITNNSNSSATNDHLQAMVKGKRTKRMRLLHALVPAAPATSSPASSSCEQSESTTTEEEEDMANCLILLAQGRTQEPWLEEEGGAGSGEAGEKLSIIRPVEAAAATEGKVGVYAYECKTCNKCFPSFQALGGHRASHKKPKMLQAAAAMAAEEKRAVDREDNVLQMSIVSYSNTNILPNNGSCRTISPTCNNNINSSNSASNNKARVHECSICGSEFSSGQALGGHMRRHRAPAPAPAPEAAQEAKKKRSILALDLNLPAPMEDGDFPRSPSFAFSGKRPLIFSASTLVDCQY